jgi:hypothetical protein
MLSVFFIYAKTFYFAEKSDWLDIILCRFNFFNHIDTSWCFVELEHITAPCCRIREQSNLVANNTITPEA